jgi:AraC-like DNA-binding protein
VAGSGYVAGRFHCDPDSDRWRETNWIGDRPHVVVPDTAVRLLPERGEPYVSTVNNLVVYDRDVHYRRQLVSAEGDRCTFLAVDEPLAVELGLRPGPGRPRLRHGACAAPVFALHHQIRAVLRAPRPDRLRLDGLAMAVLVHAAGRVGPVPPDEAGDPRTARAQRRAVEEVKAALAAEPVRAWTLADLAARVHYSPYRLARLFRARTGYTVCGYRQQLRLRLSLSDVLAGADLSGVAARHGFSSHSHFTALFRRTFGRTPSQVRRDGVRPWDAAQVLST